MLDSNNHNNKKRCNEDSSVPEAESLVFYRPLQERWDHFPALHWIEEAQQICRHDIRTTSFVLRFWKWIWRCAPGLGGAAR